jgi:uncharacterized protein
LPRLFRRSPARRFGDADKQTAIQKLTALAQRIEKDFTPSDFFDDLVKKENDDSWKYGGRTIDGLAVPPKKISK